LDGEGAIDPHKLSRDDYVVCDGEGDDGVVVDQMFLPDDQVSAAAIVDEAFALRPLEKIGLEPLMLVVVQNYTLVIVEGVELSGYRVLSVVGDIFFRPDRQHFLAPLNLVVKIQTAGGWELGAFGWVELDVEGFETLERDAADWEEVLLGMEDGEGDGFSQLVLFEEAFEDSLGSIVDLVTSHHHVRRDVLFVKYLDGVASLILDYVPRNELLGNIRQVLPLLEQCQLLLDLLHHLSQTESVLSGDVEVDLVDDIQLDSLTAVIGHHVDLNDDGFHQRLPPEDLVIEVTEVQVEVSREDMVVVVDKLVSLQSIGPHLKDRDVFVALFWDKVELEALHFKVHFLEHVLPLEQILIHAALVEEFSPAELCLQHLFVALLIEVASPESVCDALEEQQVVDRDFPPQFRHAQLAVKSSFKLAVSYLEKVLLIEFNGRLFQYPPILALKHWKKLERQT
jgi:hypothetical protein